MSDITDRIMLHLDNDYGTYTHLTEVANEALAECEEDETREEKRNAIIDAVADALDAILADIEEATPGLIARELVSLALRDFDARLAAETYADAALDAA